MCGVLIWVTRDAPVSELAFREALGLLRHRGPDSLDTLFLKPGESMTTGTADMRGDDRQDCRIALGHARLAIVDLDARANQPFTDETGRHGLVYNGEIYNFVELRAELEAAGHRFRTASDTEVLFQILQRRGVEGTKALNGMFAFAQLDTETGTLTLCRDRYGKKPLFFYTDERQFIAASEIKAVMHLAAIGRRLHADLLASFVMSKITVDMGDDRSLYAGVHQLRPGHALQVDTRTMATRSWAVQSLRDAASEPASVAQLAGDLEAAVTRRLRADVPMAVLLSGGVDSTIIAAHAAAATTEQPVRFYTVRNLDGSGAALADTRYARELADSLGIDLIEVELESEESRFADDLLTMTRQYELPVNPFLIAYSSYRVYRAIHRDGIKVVLDGTGGDELFGGYPGSSLKVARNRLARRHLGGVWRHLAAERSLRGKSPLEVAHLCAQLARLSVTGFRCRDKSECQRYRDFRHYSRATAIDEAAERLLDGRIGRHDAMNLTDIQWYDIERALLPYALYVNDQMAMHFSIENRSPLLDDDALKYVAMDDTEKFHDGFNKVALRRAMPNSVPNSIRWRAGKDGMAFNAAYFGKYAGDFLDMVAGSRFVAEILDRDRLVDDARRNRVDFSFFRSVIALAALDDVYRVELAEGHAAGEA